MGDARAADRDDAVCNAMGVPVGSAWNGLRAGNALAVGVGRAAAPSAWPGEPVAPAPRPVTGSPQSAVVMGRAGSAAGLPVRAVALDDHGDVIGADAMKCKRVARRRSLLSLTACQAERCRAVVPTLRVMAEFCSVSVPPDTERTRETVRTDEKRMCRSANPPGE